MTKNICKTKKIRAVAVIINKGDVLLMYRLKNGKEYYVFPGGGVEKGETVEQAVLRETKEETSVKIRIEKLLYHHIYDDGTEHFFYLCRYLSGKPSLDEANELRSMREENNNFYNPEWHRIKDLLQLLLYPLEIRDWLLDDIKTNFRNTPKRAVLKVSELRHSF